MNITSSATLDMKQINAMLRRMESLETHEAQYGYFEGDTHLSSGLPMPWLVKTLNEDRPFMDYAGDMVERHFDSSKMWKNDVWNYLKGTGTVIQLYKSFGRIGETYVQASIDVGAPDWDNVEWWRKAKIEKYGSTAPLIESGEMYNSVSSKVVKHSKGST
jgi:hypothetical protein